jgi:hypothetical protein
MKFSVNIKKVPEKQYYQTTVNQQASLDTLRDIREHEQSVQPFTQNPALGQAGAPTHDGLCAYDLFSLFTAEIIAEQKVFVR